MGGSKWTLAEEAARSPGLVHYCVLKTRDAERAKFSGSYIDSTLAGGAIAWPVYH
jgi:hypothetical protein